MSYTRMTELDAVNQVLEGRGLAPVQTIEGATSKHTQIALNVVRRLRKQVQMETWDFNFEPCYTLALDAGTGEIPIPANLAQFKVPDEPWVVIDGDKLYNKKDRTSTFTSAKEGHALFILDWDELPEVAKNYIAAKAARTVYEKYVGADETRQSLYLEEQEARRQLEQHSTESAGYNMLDWTSRPFLRGSQRVPGTPDRRYYR